MAGRPSLPPSQRRRSRGIRLTDAESTALDQLAALLGTSRNSAVVAAVEAAIEAHTTRQESTP